MLVRILKVFVLIVLIMMVAGFGLCGAMGVVIGIGSNIDPSIVMLGLLGIAIAVALGFVVRALLRSLK